MQNVFFRERSTDECFEVLAGPYLVEREDGWVNCVLGAWVDGLRSGELEEMSIDSLTVYFRRE